jgi:hypothetical protein
MPAAVVPAADAVPAVYPAPRFNAALAVQRNVLYLYAPRVGHGTTTTADRHGAAWGAGCAAGTAGWWRWATAK